MLLLFHFQLKLEFKVPMHEPSKAVYRFKSSSLASTITIIVEEKLITNEHKTCLCISCSLCVNTIRFAFARLFRLFQKSNYPKKLRVCSSRKSCCGLFLNLRHHNSHKTVTACAHAKNLSNYSAKYAQVNAKHHDPTFNQLPRCRNLLFHFL